MCNIQANDRDNVSGARAMSNKQEHHQNIAPNNPRCWRGGACVSERSADKLFSCFMTCSSDIELQFITMDKLHAYLLKLVFSLLQLEMSPYYWVLAGKLDNLASLKVIEQPRIDLPREL
jgi:hypothetical protein